MPGPDLVDAREEQLGRAGDVLGSFLLTLRGIGRGDVVDRRQPSFVRPRRIDVREVPAHVGRRLAHLGVLGAGDGQKILGADEPLQVFELRARSDHGALRGFVRVHPLRAFSQRPPGREPRARLLHRLAVAVQVGAPHGFELVDGQRHALRRPQHALVPLGAEGEAAAWRDASAWNHAPASRNAAAASWRALSNAARSVASVTEANTCGTSVSRYVASPVKRRWPISASGKGSGGCSVARICATAAGTRLAQSVKAFMRAGSAAYARATYTLGSSASA